MLLSDTYMWSHATLQRPKHYTNALETFILQNQTKAVARFGFAKKTVLKSFIKFTEKHHLSFLKKWVRRSCWNPVNFAKVSEWIIFIILGLGMNVEPLQYQIAVNVKFFLARLYVSAVYNISCIMKIMKITRTSYNLLRLNKSFLKKYFALLRPF